MAANGFIELLRLTDLGNKHQISQEDQTARWSGVAFEMDGKQFVAPLGDVSEVIYTPEWTQIPNAPKWICGIANIRGRLLSVSHLKGFLTNKTADIKANSKVLCLNHSEHYCGVIVDQVFGIQHFNTQSYFKKSEDLPAEIATFCQGYFVFQNKPWHVFMFRDLLENQRFNSST